MKQFIKTFSHEDIFMREDDLELKTSLFEVTVEKLIDGEWEEVGGDFLEDIEEDPTAERWRVGEEEFFSHEEMIGASWEDSYVFDGNGYDTPYVVATDGSERVSLSYVRRGRDLTTSHGVVVEWEEVWKNMSGEEIVVTVSDSNLQNSPTLYCIP